MVFLRKLATFISVIAMIIAAIMVSVGNHVVTDFRLWPIETPLSAPLSMLIVGSFGIGLIFGGAAMLIPLLRCRLEQRRLRAAMNKMEKAASDFSRAMHDDGNGDAKPRLAKD